MFVLCVIINTKSKMRTIKTKKNKYGEIFICVSPCYLVAFGGILSIKLQKCIWWYTFYWSTGKVQSTREYKKKTRWGRYFPPWGPPSLIYNKYRVSLPRVKRPGRDVSHPPLSNADINDRVEQHLHSSSVLSWPVLGWTLPYIVSVQFN
jgi:hypothetical protein